MKKLFWILPAIVIAVAVGWLYFFVPNQLQIVNSVTVKAPEAAVTRLLLFDNGWKKWWPDERQTSNRVFTYGDVTCRVEKFTNSYVNVALQRRNLTVPGVIDFMADEKNATVLRWTVNHRLGADPIRRLMEYWQLKKIDRNIGRVLEHFQNFTDDKKNIYGIDIEYSKVKDTVVATIRNTTRKYPSTTEIYTLVQSLQDYNRKNEIEETGFPMLNITRLEANYHITIAIPVKKKAPSANDIEFKNLVPGNILIAEVKGGKKTIENAMLQMNNYVRDMRHTSPAVPFQKLVTNRLTEPDSSKWITELYYPIL